MTNEETFYIDDDFVRSPYWQPLLFEDRLKNCLMKAIGDEKLASDLAACVDECDAREIADWLGRSHETDFGTIWKRIVDCDGGLCETAEVAR